MEGRKENEMEEMEKAIKGNKFDKCEFYFFRFKKDDIFILKE